MLFQNTFFENISGVLKMLLCWHFYRETLHFLYPLRCCTRELLSIKKLVKDLFNRLTADLGLCNGMVHLFCLTSYLLKLFCTKSLTSTTWAQHQSNVRIIDSHFTYCKSILLSSKSVYKAAKIQSKMIGIKIKLEVWFYAEYMQSYLKTLPPLFIGGVQLSQVCTPTTKRQFTFLIIQIFPKACSQGFLTSLFGLMQIFSWFLWLF